MSAAREPLDPTAHDVVWQDFWREPSATHRNRLVERYWPRVLEQAARFARRLPTPAREPDQLASDGLLGLLDAIEKFDPQRGTRFGVYLWHRVRGAMLDGLRQADWVPRSVRRPAARLAEQRRALAVQLGHAPTDEELAEFLSLAPTVARQQLATARTARQESFDGPLSAAGHASRSRELSLGDAIADRRQPAPAAAAEAADFWRLVTRGLAGIERLVLLGYFFEGRYLREIGAELDLSESRISQILRDVLARLRERLKAEG